MDAILIENISGLKTMGGDFYFSKNSNKTIVKATLKYSMTNVFFGMMNAMMGRKKFTKTWKSIMVGYKLHTETGVIVTEKTVLPVEEVKLLEVKKHLNK